MCVATILSFATGPAKSFHEPELARIIFFHLPCAFVCSVFVIAASYYSLRYLRSKDLIWDYRSKAANEIAFATGICTMLTGILFSKVQWTAWWNWDPRQTSFLIVLLLLGAYFGLRAAYDDEILRARAAAVYASLALVPVIFLIFVFPRMAKTLQRSLHPSLVIQTNGFSSEYWIVITVLFAFLLWFCMWLFKLAVQTSLLEQRLKDSYGTLEAHSCRTTAHRVDRDVSLHEPSQ